MIPLRRLSLGRGFSADRYARYYLLRLLPHPWARDAGAWALGRWVRLTQTRPAGTAPKLPIDDHVNRLRRDGWTGLPPLLTDTQIEEMRTYLETQPTWDGERRVDLANAPRRAAYDVASIVACPHALDVMNDPAVLALARHYLGCTPTIVTLGLRWSFPDPRERLDVQRFHRDTETWRILNLFVYLTDVDETSGPHTYVLGSHRTRGRWRLKPYAEDDLRERFGASRLHTIVGPRGTSFMEDGWGIHQAVPPTARPRLLLSVMFSYGPIPIYEYRPVALASPSRHDQYVNRLLLA